MIAVAPGLIESAAGHGGGLDFVVRGCSDVESARRGLRLAGEAVRGIGHPEEPDEPLPSFVSPVVDGPHGPSIWFDISDIEAYPGLMERVTAAVLDALDQSGVTDGTLTSERLV